MQIFWNAILLFRLLQYRKYNGIITFKELYQVKHSVTGARYIVREVIELVTEMKEDNKRDLDQLAWAILKHI